MSYIDYLKIIDKGAHDIKRDVDIGGINIPVYDVKNYEIPLDRENILTDIYDKMYLSGPLSYNQAQLMTNYERLRSGLIYSFSPFGQAIEAPKHGFIPKMNIKKKGLKKKK